MFTHEEYIWAWIVYLLGAAACMGVFWYLTRKIVWREVRDVLRIGAGVFMLVPWYSSEGGGYLSPAWIACILEGMFEGPGAFWRAGTPLIIALIVALALSSSVYFFLWLRSRRLA